VFLPASVQSQGCKVGDTVMLRGSIVYAVLDESVPQVQEILKIMEEKNADPDEHYYMINDGTRRGTEPPEEIRGAGRPIHRTNLMTLMTTLLGDYTLEDIDFRETLRSEVVELPVTIAGFYDADPYSMHRQTSVLMSRECMDFAEAMYMAAAPLTEQWQEDYLTADDETAGFGGTEMLSYDTNAGWFACISEKIPFSDGLTMLLTSAGAKDPELVEYYFSAGSLNGTLLMTKFRYMNAATDIMLLFASFSLLLILIWAFSRFVIDNAFEISVQERSVQFAALRLPQYICKLMFHALIDCCDRQVFRNSSKIGVPAGMQVMVGCIGCFPADFRCCSAAQIGYLLDLEHRIIMIQKGHRKGGHFHLQGLGLQIQRHSLKLGIHRFGNRCGKRSHRRLIIHRLQCQGNKRRILADAVGGKQ